MLPSETSATGLFGRVLRHVVLALLLVKLAITAWNCLTFDGLTYDQRGLAIPRARGAGLSLDGRAYNPPLYYLPVLPLVPPDAWYPGKGHSVDASGDAAEDDDTARKPSSKGKKAARKVGPIASSHDQLLLKVLRWTNLFHLSVFYVCWIYGIFSVLLGRGSSWAVASCLLLTLPGYQKVAVMVHADNALGSLSALTIASWLWLRRRIDSRHGSDARGSASPPFERAELLGLLGLALAGGLTGLTRPFGMLVSGASCVMIVLLVARRTAYLTRAFFAYAAPLCALVVVLSTAWQTYQLAAVGRLVAVGSGPSEAYYEPARKSFDRVHFFTSFYLKELIEVPNRTINALDETSSKFENRYGNSFFTSAYSEIWGDHWLLFTSADAKETKLWQKRVILIAALPLIPLFLWRFGRGVALAVRNVARRVPDQTDTSAFFLLFMLLGLAAYFAWQQGGSGLSPGKNSGVKFIYVAYLVPVPILLSFMPELSLKQARLWLGYLAVLFVLALPIAIW